MSDNEEGDHSNSNAANGNDHVTEEEEIIFLLETLSECESETETLEESDSGDNQAVANGAEDQRQSKGDGNSTKDIPTNSQPTEDLKAVESAITNDNRDVIENSVEAKQVRAKMGQEDRAQQQSQADDKRNNISPPSRRPRSRRNEDSRDKKLKEAEAAMTSNNDDEAEETVEVAKLDETRAEQQSKADDQSHSITPTRRRPRNRRNEDNRKKKLRDVEASMTSKNGDKPDEAEETVETSEAGDRGIKEIREQSQADDDKMNDTSPPRRRPRNRRNNANREQKLREVEASMISNTDNDKADGAEQTKGAQGEEEINQSSNTEPNNPPQSRKPRNRRNHDNDSARVEKLREVGATTMNASNNCANTPDEVGRHEELQQEAKRTSDPHRDEADAFAARRMRHASGGISNAALSTVVSTRELLSSFSTNVDKSGPDIKVQPNPENPTNHADVFVSTPTNREHNQLLTILLLKLQIEGWNVISVSTQSEATSTERTQQHIVVQIPNRGNDSTDTSILLLHLRQVLLEAVKEGEGGSIRSLVQSFESNVLQQSSPSNRLSPQSPSLQINTRPLVSAVRRQKQLPPFSTTTTTRRTRASAVPSPDETVSSSSMQPERSSATAVTTRTRVSFPEERTSDATTGSNHPPQARPGAHPTMGRAFGAPFRRSMLNRTRRWISSMRSTSNRFTSTRHNNNLSRRHRNAMHVDGSRSIHSSHMPVAAEVVLDDEDDVEENIRQRIIAEAASASVVISDDHRLEEQVKIHQRRMKRFLVFGAVVMGLVLGLTFGLYNSSPEAINADANSSSGDDDGDASDISSVVAMSPAPSSSPTETHIPTLTRIMERGHIRCCASNFTTVGALEMELCRGLAAAVFGDVNKYEARDCDSRQGYILLEEEQSIDVMIRFVPKTITHSIREGQTGSGFAFSSPYFYDGFVFGGKDEEKVNCVSNRNSRFGICRELSICLVEDGRGGQAGFLSPFVTISTVQNYTNVLDGPNPVCNVIGAYLSEMHLRLEEAAGESGGPFFVSTNDFTKDPLSIVTRSKDYEWSLFVETFLQGLFEAEVRGITQANATVFPSVTYFGPEHERMVAQAVEGIGNFGEVYDWAIGTTTPRMGLNRVFDAKAGCGSLAETSNGGDDRRGLIYGLPTGPGLIGEIDRGNPNDKISKVIESQILRCGLPEGPEMAFHREICKAIAIFLFGREGVNDVFFQQYSYHKNVTSTLASVWNHEIDILMGVGSSILPALGTILTSYSTSFPYFYRPNQEDGSTEAFVMVTSSEDYQWSKLVELIVDMLIITDERFISKERGGLPPGSRLIGRDYDRKTGEIIGVLGNYDEIYSRTVSMPREDGCNQRNDEPFGPQMFPYLFHGL